MLTIRVKKRARNPHSLTSEWFRLLRSIREISERGNGEGVTAVTEAEVSGEGSFSLVGVSGEEGNVVGETQDSRGREGTMVGETGLIEGSMALDPDDGGRR